MKRGRWIAVGVCTLVVGAATALLYVVLWGSDVRVAPIAALVLLAAAPFLAAWFSANPNALVTAAGGLACGIAATVAAAALRQGGTGALPLALGVVVSGAVALRGTSGGVWPRVLGVAVIAGYAVASERLISVVFAYPVLGIADELADMLSRRSGDPAVKT